MKTKVVLVRHGQTDWNVIKRWQGHTDIPLNQNGITQARAVAKRLCKWNIHAIYASDLLRASVTAQYISEQLGLWPTCDAIWRERHAGDLEGTTRSERAEKFNIGSDWYIDPPGGEPWIKVRERVTAAFDAVTEKHAGQTVCVVTHGGTLRALFSVILGVPPDKRVPISFRGNTGISVVEVSESGIVITCLNDTAHLE